MVHYNYWCWQPWFLFDWYKNTKEIATRSQLLFANLIITNMSANMSAIELLQLGDCERKKPWVNYYWAQILGIGMGVSAGAYLNYQTRRPAFSGAHYIIPLLIHNNSINYASVPIVMYLFKLLRTYHSNCSSMWFIIGIQKHILISVGLTGVFYYIQKKREDYLAEKDAVYRNYVELHPEDFPCPGMSI